MTDRQPDATGSKPEAKPPETPPKTETTPKTETAPKPAPAKPGAKTPPPRPPTRRGPLAALGLVLAASLGLGLWTWYAHPEVLIALGITSGPTSGGGFAGTPDRIETLTTRVRALEAALDGVSQKTETIGDVGTQIGVLTEQESAIDRRVSEIESRLNALEARLGEGKLAGQAAAEASPMLARRVEALESRLAAGTVDPATLMTLRTDYATRLTQHDTQLAALEKLMKGADVDARQTATVFAAGRLRTAMDAGTPFASPLAALGTLIHAGPLAGDQTLLKALENLGSRAEAGVPTLPTLRARFEATARAVLAANARPGPDAGVIDRVASGLGGLVSVRRTGEVTGADAEALVARAEQRLLTNDLAQAVAEMAGLAGEAAKAANSWLEDARARLAADSAMDTLDGRIAGTLGTPLGIGEGAVAP